MRGPVSQINEALVRPVFIIINRIINWILNDFFMEYLVYSILEGYKNNNTIRITKQTGDNYERVCVPKN